MMDELDDNSDLSDTLGGRIVTAREAEQMTTVQLARHIGVKTETLSAWESDRSEPRPNQLVTISGMLNVSPTWLLTGEGDSPSQVISESDLSQLRGTLSRLREKILGIGDELEQLENQLETYRHDEE